MVSFWEKSYSEGVFSKSKISCILIGYINYLTDGSFIQNII